MFSGLHSAVTGMSAQQLVIDTISHDIANINTTGFKKHRAEFKDLMYVNRPVIGKPSDDGVVLPIIQMGLGVKNSVVRRIPTQGTLIHTDDDLSMAIKGKGFFVVNMPDGSVRYTRDGSFTRDSNGNITTAEGYLISPGITIPPNATSVAVNESGEVSAIVPDQLTPTVLGRIDIVTFINEVGLEEEGNNLLKETEASGDPVQGTAGDVDFGYIMQHWLENSNVDPLTSLTELLKANRAYELALKALTFTIEHLKLNTHNISI